MQIVESECIVTNLWWCQAYDFFLWTQARLSVKPDLIHFFYYVINLLSMLRLLTNSQTFVPAIITTDIAYCVNITTIDIVFFFYLICQRDSNCHQIASVLCNLPRTIDWLLHVINFLIFILKMLQRTPRFLPSIYCFAPFHNLLCSFLYLFLSCTYCQFYQKT